MRNIERINSSDMRNSLSASTLEKWRRLALAPEHVDPFCSSPAWHLPFHHTFKPNRKIVFQENETSLVVMAEQLDFCQSVTLEPVESHWHFGCPLLGLDSVELLKELVESYRQNNKNFCFALSGICTGTVLSRKLVDTFGNDFDIQIRIKNYECMASLDGGFDGYLSRRSAKHRKNIARENRRAKDHGIEFERVVPTTYADADQTYSRMAAVESRSWKGIGNCGMNESPSREFYREMIRMLSTTSEARVIFARKGDKDMGFIFGGMLSMIYRGQQFSFDDEYKNLSLGNLLQLEQVRWLCDEGAVRYDMGPSRGPSMSYKRHWTEQEQVFVTAEFLAKSIFG
ncbi:MAG TPA: GNAT family N-acetyltransferase [Pseudomonadales bacterium]|nr:GNAT family N-acetyltransferase [Pseudomonadales bacterium]HRG51051.1 GNAT family N-acetyltransferase [Pseudomonadales bacterium]